MSVLENVRKNTAAAVVDAVAACVAAGDFTVENVPEIMLEVPREESHGEFACNIAMQMAREAKLPPRKIAEAIIARIPKEGTDIDVVEIAGPGFINFKLGSRWLMRVIPEVLAGAEAYGRSDIGTGEKVQVEFVSANPTGPLHMGNARGAGIGTVLANLLDWAGYTVQKEFYINDAGNQIENFGKSLEARYLELFGQQVVFPEDGYHGNDIIELMRGLIEEEGNRWLDVDSAQRRQRFIDYSLQRKITAMKTDLAKFRVDYDVWFSEHTLHESGAVLGIIDELEARGHIEVKDGAKWLKLTDFGEEKDEVLIRTNGIPTYFASDIAYHKNKFDRGFDRVINIWGADHHGHVSRMKAAMSALGYDPDRLEVLIMQLVRLVRGGEQVRMSKRAGEMVTLSDLIDEVGVDAARYFFVMRSADSHLDFDLDLAVSQSNDNPVYYIQYAHARIASIFRQMEERGIAMPDIANVDLSVLEKSEELDLIKKLATFPEEIASAAVGREVHRIARYALELAGLFHAFYNSCRCIGVEQELQDARILLAVSVQYALKNVLSILEISVPDKM